MIIREKYLKEIRGFYYSDLIKVITGVRRCGKSVILSQIKRELKKESENILMYDFENRALTRSIRTWTDLVDDVCAKKTEGLCYVFLDEVQEIENWSLACRSLRQENCSVFITGSNSKLLSKEFTKELSGRYVAFQVRPFVYRELATYARELNRDYTLSDYLVWGGFPKCLEMNDSDRLRYLTDLDHTIVTNDIINRYKIRKESIFKKVIDFLLVSNARKYSAHTISKTLASFGSQCSYLTVQKWVDYLQEAYIVEDIRVFSKKAKSLLANSKKLYLCDVSLNSIRAKENRYDLTHNLENAVFSELLYMGYKVFVYDNNGREIDFLAQKDNLRYFVQVAYSVVEEETYRREISAFKGIGHEDKKILITMDETDFSTSTVIHVPFSKFVELEDLKSV